MKQTSCETNNSSSAINEISCILRNPNLYYCVYNSPTFVRILSQVSPVHVSHSISLISISVLFSHYLFQGLPSCFFPSGFPSQTLYGFSSPHSCFMPHIFHLPRYINSNSIWLNKESCVFFPSRYSLTRTKAVS